MTDVSGDLLMNIQAHAQGSSIIALNMTQRSFSVSTLQLACNGSV